MCIKVRVPKRLQHGVGSCDPAAGTNDGARQAIEHSCRLRVASSHGDTDLADPRIAQQGIDRVPEQRAAGDQAVLLCQRLCARGGGAHADSCGRNQRDQARN